MGEDRFIFCKNRDLGEGGVRDKGTPRENHSSVFFFCDVCC